MIDLPAPYNHPPACLIEAAETYTIPARGLIALWITEGGRVGMQNKNTNNSVDYGPMQINTVWVNELNKEFGITTDMLTSDICLSFRAAAYILRYEINLAGGDFWEGVGHYHSRTPKHKYKYIKRVYQNAQRF